MWIRNPDTDSKSGYKFKTQVRTLQKHNSSRLRGKKKKSPQNLKIQIHQKLCLGAWNQNLGKNYSELDAGLFRPRGGGGGA